MKGLTAVLVILICIAIAIIALTSCNTEHRITKRDKVMVQGDEIPGMGANIYAPDTCVAYYDKGRIHIRYITRHY